MEKLEFLMIPRQILYNEALTLSQKLTLSAVYYLLTDKKINNRGKNNKERLRMGVCTKILNINNLQSLTNLSKSQLKNDLDFFINEGIIEVIIDEGMKYIAAGTREDKLFDLFSISFKKTDKTEISGYIPMNSYIIDNDLNLTEKFISLLSVYSETSHKECKPSNKSLSRWLNKGERSIQRSIKSLEEKGLLVVDTKPNSRVIHSNIDKYKETSQLYIENMTNIKNQVNIQQNIQNQTNINIVNVFNSMDVGFEIEPVDESRLAKMIGNSPLDINKLMSLLNIQCNKKAVK